MKKVLILILLVLIAVGGYFGFTRITKENHDKEIREGWYVKIINKYVNVRKDPTSSSELVTQVHKGDVYKVLEYVDTNSSYFWYKIQIDDKTTGYIANPRSVTADKYLEDHNNPTDIANPTLVFYEDTYKVRSINDINYNHLTLWDDKEGYKVTHKVYHEYVYCEEDDFYCEPKDQYWIVYTITDAVGKSSSKTQRIEFDIRPDEDEVLDFFKDYGKN